jgi:hypothetical protein
MLDFDLASAVNRRQQSNDIVRAHDPGHKNRLPAEPTKWWSVIEWRKPRPVRVLKRAIMFAEHTWIVSRLELTSQRTGRRATPFVTLSAAADYNLPRDFRMGTSLRMGTIAVLVLACALPSLAKKKQEEPLATLTFVVLKDENGKPVRNAAVVMHPVGDDGKQERGGIELKTDPEGKTSYEGVPYGKLRVQVLAPGFQTFGEDYNIGQPNMDITIKLKRPTKQYSIYEDHPTPNPNAPADKNPQPQQNAPPKP